MKFISTLAIILTLSCQAFGWLGFKREKYTTNRQVIVRFDDRDRWIDQALDHFDPTDTRTWKQRYFLNDDYYKEGGPIFLMLSGEQFADPSWLDETTSLEGYMAKMYGAKLIFLEHRYYGQSHPTANLSVDNLLYLSADQSLADTAYFINNITEKYNIPPSSKWVLFGASYAGSLVAWMRYKYPHLVYAAVANSGPLHAQVDFKDFFLVVEKAVKKHSPKCVDELGKAYNDLYNQLKSPANYEKLENQFHVCEHFATGNTKPYDVSTFFEAILEIVYRVVFEDSVFNPAIKSACKIIEDESMGKPLERLAKVNEISLEEDYLLCLSTEKYDDTVNALLDQTWGGQGIYERGWIYQTCTEFGWYQSTSGRPFNIPKDAIPIKMYRQLCGDVFGSKIEKLMDAGVKRTNLIYGGREIVNTTSNTIFVHGGNDPWHVAGIYESNNPQAPVIIVDGGEHVPLLYPPSDSDSPSKAKAKQQVIKILGSWLNEA